MEVTHEVGLMTVIAVYAIESDVYIITPVPNAGPTDSHTWVAHCMTEEGAKQMVLSYREKYGIPKYGLDPWE